MTYRGDIFHFHVRDQWHTQELAIDKEVKLHIFVIRWNKAGKIHVQVSLFIWYHQEQHNSVAGSGEWSQQEVQKDKTNKQPPPTKQSFFFSQF